MIITHGLVAGWLASGYDTGAASAKLCWIYFLHPHTYPRQHIDCTAVPSRCITPMNDEHHTYFL